MTEKEESVGYVEIQTLRSKYEANFNVYVLTDKPILHLGEFELFDSQGKYQWNYADFDTSELEIYSINETEHLPQSLDRLVRACQQVSPQDKWFQYALLIWSTETKDDLEHEIDEWLSKELGTHKVIVEAVKLPKVKSRKRIPIPKRVWNKVLEKIKTEAETKEHEA